MPSSRYIAVDSHARIPTFHKNIFGRSAPLLLKDVIREVKGGSLEKCKRKSVVVGTIYTPSSIP